MKWFNGVLAVLGRLLLSLVFLLSAVGQKIPHFSDVAKIMDRAGVPLPEFMLAGAIVFLIAGSVSVILGYRARWGAGLLAVFLILATYYFHNFWALSDPQAVQAQMIQFMKNLALLGAMVFIMVNGAGRLSIDEWAANRVRKTVPETARFGRVFAG